MDSSYAKILEQNRKVKHPQDWVGTRLGQLNDRSFIALGHHYAERDVVRKRSRPEWNKWQMNETPTQVVHWGAVV